MGRLQHLLPFDQHAEGIGMTGWDWQAPRSRWVAFDFDSLTGHAKGVGITDEELEKVKQAAMRCPIMSKSARARAAAASISMSTSRSRHPLREPHGPRRAGPLRSWA